MIHSTHPTGVIHCSYGRLESNVVDVIIYIFAHLHTALRAKRNMLDKN